MTVAERILREKLVAHAPPVPHWFEPTMGSPRPCLLPEDEAVREEYLDHGLTSDARFPSEALSAWINKHAEDLEHEVLLAREWDQAQERQRLLQWPWSYADGVMAARDASARRICRAIDDAVTHTVYVHRSETVEEPAGVAFGLSVCMEVSATVDQTAMAVDEIRKVITSAVLRELVRLGILPDREWKRQSRAAAAAQKAEAAPTVAVDQLAPQHVSDLAEALR